MARIVATPVEIGPFFVGDQLPNLFPQLSWDTGGAVDLTDWPNASYEVTRLRGTAVVSSGTKTGGQIVYNSLPDGELTIIWAQAFADPGWYKLRLTLTDAQGHAQSAQELRWEVQDR